MNKEEASVERELIQYFSELTEELNYRLLMEETQEDEVIWVENIIVTEVKAAQEKITIHRKESWLQNLKQKMILNIRNFFRKFWV